MINPAPLYRFILCLVFLFAVLGCAPQSPTLDPALNKKAENALRKIRLTNQNITAAKGLGWIKIKTGQHVLKYKIAWAAVSPDKIRISLLMSGHPIETVAADGKNVTFISHTGSHKPYKTFSNDPDMERFIKVPVKLSDLISLLLGHIPLMKHDLVYFSPKDPALKTLILKKTLGGLRQKISLNDDDLPSEIKTTGIEGQTLYRMMIFSYTSFNHDAIPAVVHLFDAKQREIILTITTFQANPVIKPSVFRLTAN